MSKLHADGTEGEIHQIHDAEYASLNAAQAASFTSGDVGKAFRITDGPNYYIKKNASGDFFDMLIGEVAEVQTTNATETNLFSFATSTDYVYHVHAYVSGTVNTGGNAASYERVASFKNDSGTLSIIGSTTAVHTAEDDANWDCQVEASGTSIQVNVTGVAATTIDWLGRIVVLEQKNS